MLGKKTVSVSHQGTCRSSHRSSVTLYPRLGCVVWWSSYASLHLVFTRMLRAESYRGRVLLVVEFVHLFATTAAAVNTTATTAATITIITTTAAAATTTKKDFFK